MANLLFFLLIITISILIILMSVSVRFVYIDKPILRFDFLFFNLTLFPSYRKKNKRKKKINAIKSTKRRFTQAFSLKKSLDYLLKRSDVKIEKIDLILTNTDPAGFILREKNISTVIFILLAYLSLKSGNFITEGTCFTAYEDSKAKASIDITLTSTLFHILVAILIFSHKNAKKKRKRVKKIVREQNERYY